RLSRERLARSVGQRLLVMIDGPAQSGRKTAPAEGGAWAARTAGQAWEVDGGVLVEARDGHSLAPGKLVEVQVTGNGAYDRFARLVPAPGPGPASEPPRRPSGSRDLPLLERA